MITETESEYQSDAGSTKDTPYLVLTGELLGVFCECLGVNWPCYNGTALYSSASAIAIFLSTAPKKVQHNNTWIYKAPHIQNLEAQDKVKLPVRQGSLDKIVLKTKYKLTGKTVLKFCLSQVVGQ